VTLGEKQRLFAKMLGEFLTWCYQNGYEVTLGEAQRSLEQAVANSRSGAGIVHSLHLIRLAVDLNLFIGGVYQAATEAYKPLGEKWESMGGAWGGRFTSRPDGNHFSLEHNGVK
jgi:hypothetical protein